MRNTSVTSSDCNPRPWRKYDFAETLSGRRRDGETDKSRAHIIIWPIVSMPTSFSRVVNIQLISKKENRTTRSRLKPRSRQRAESSWEFIVLGAFLRSIYKIILVVVVRLVCAKTFRLTLYLGNLTRLMQNTRGFL